jgi:hypothetical protein
MWRIPEQLCESGAKSVSSRYLEALEQGNFSHLPEETYTLGFLTTYCRFLDLDPDPFIAALHGQGSPIAKPGRFATRRTDEVLARPFWVADVVTWGTICALLLLGWFTFNTVTRPFAEGEEGRVDASTMQAPEQDPSDIGF